MPVLLADPLPFIPAQATMVNAGKAASACAASMDSHNPPVLVDEVIRRA
jgi:hypothetical protein